MQPDPDLALLDDIAEASAHIAREVAGLDRASFVESTSTRSAVAWQLTVVGEAVIQLSENLKSAHADVPWEQVRGFRNRIVHGYRSVDWEIVWTIATTSVPDLSNRIAEIQNKLMKPSSIDEMDQ